MLTKPRCGGTLCEGQEGGGGACRWGEGWDLLMGEHLGPSDGGTSQSCCPAGRTRALTSAPFAGPQASSQPM